MTPREYQYLARRTRCPQHRALGRLESCSFAAAQTTSIDPPDHSGAMLLHGVIGLTGEVGELAGAIERYAYYEKDFDRLNVIEEMGDVLWYLSELCDALDIPMERVMRLNISKLRKRFPENFDHELAKEENRDRAAEARAMDDGVSYEED